MKNCDTITIIHATKMIVAIKNGWIIVTTPAIISGNPEMTSVVAVYIEPINIIAPEIPITMKYPTDPTPSKNVPAWLAPIKPRIIKNKAKYLLPPLMMSSPIAAAFSSFAPRRGASIIQKNIAARSANTRTGFVT